jgi:hypothetical protein
VKRNLFRSVFILDVVTVVYFMVQNIAVQFEYQKHVQFRNGYIVNGYVLSFYGRGKIYDKLSTKCVKASVFVITL